MTPSIPKVPNELQRGAVDLGKVREELAKDQADTRDREERAMEKAAEAFRRSMNRTFKGITGGSSLHRRFHARAALKKMERGGDE